MIKKDFDCVEMKWKAQEALYDELKPTSFHDYFQKLKTLSQNSEWLQNAKFSSAHKQNSK